MLILLLFSSCDFGVPLTGTPTICAHRGFHKYSVENSLQSFVDAKRCKLSWAELDIWSTTDSKMVVTHDRNLKRCYNVDLNVDEVSFDELRNHATLNQVPELKDVWDEVKGELKLQIEVKDSDVVPMLLQFFKDNNCYDECIVISFYSDVLETIKEANSSITCGLLASIYDDKFLSYDYIDILALNYNSVTSQVVAKAHNCGKKLYVWTVDKTSDMRRMQLMGADSITTNYPDRALSTISFR